MDYMTKRWLFKEQIVRKRAIPSKGVLVGSIVWQMQTSLRKLNLRMFPWIPFLGVWKRKGEVQTLQRLLAVKRESNAPQEKYPRLFAYSENQKYKREMYHKSINQPDCIYVNVFYKDSGYYNFELSKIHFTIACFRVFFLPAYRRMYIRIVF